MRSLIIAEKPELGRAIADAIDGNGKEVRGVIRKQNVIITWAYGHLLRLCEPDEYDAKYKKWKKRIFLSALKTGSWFRMEIKRIEWNRLWR